MNHTTKAACNTSVDAALLAEAKSLNISPSVVQYARIYRAYLRRNCQFVAGHQPPCEGG